LAAFTTGRSAGTGPAIWWTTSSSNADGLDSVPHVPVQAWLHVTLPLKVLSWLTTLMLLCNLMALLICRLHMLIMMDGLAISANDMYPRLTPSAWTVTTYSIFFSKWFSLN
jgi:hypothetical protein